MSRGYKGVMGIPPSEPISCRTTDYTQNEAAGEFSPGSIKTIAIVADSSYKLRGRVALGYEK